MESATGASHALVGEGEGVRSALVSQECFNYLLTNTLPHLTLPSIHVWRKKFASFSWKQCLAGSSRMLLTQAAPATQITTPGK
jgi:hypothetical protein